MVSKSTELVVLTLLLDISEITTLSLSFYFLLKKHLKKLCLCLTGGGIRGVTICKMTFRAIWILTPSVVFTNVYFLTHMVSLDRSGADILTAEIPFGLTQVRIHSWIIRMLARLHWWPHPAFMDTQSSFQFGSHHLPLPFSNTLFKKKNHNPIHSSPKSNINIIWVLDGSTIKTAMPCSWNNI